jgi:hypothetical protein
MAQAKHYVGFWRITDRQLVDVQVLPIGRRLLVEAAISLKMGWDAGHDMPSAVWVAWSTRGTDAEFAVCVLDDRLASIPIPQDIFEEIQDAADEICRQGVDCDTSCRTCLDYH